MSRTIIQHIGPLQGEVENGSIFGQANGSVSKQGYVPTPKIDSIIWEIKYDVYWSRWNYYRILTDIDTDNLTRTLKVGTESSQGMLSSVLFTQQLIADISSIKGTVYSTIEIFSDSDLKTLFYATPKTEVTSRTVQETPESIGYEVHGVEVMPKVPPEFTTGELYYLRIALKDDQNNYLGYYSNILEFTGY